MATPTLVYVDPAIAANSGTGTIGDPFGDIQFALDNTTRDATNGNQFNIKAGTDEILTAALTLTIYGTAPTAAAPLVFRGYTSAANDGGIGGISGNGSLGMIAGTPPSTYLVDMHPHNSGAAAILTLGTLCMIVGCEINNTSGAAILCGSGGQVIRNHIHDIGGVGIGGALDKGFIYGNFLKNGTKSFTTAIAPTAVGNVAAFNIISIAGSSIGISFAQEDCKVINNSIYSNGGTGTGIVGPTNAARRIIVLNNIVEGFSGSGGKGLSIVTGHLALYANNKYYNNATHENITGNKSIDLGNNATLGASPFASPATDNFMVDTSVKAGAYPTSFKGSITNQFLDVGAAQREEAGSGGGLLVHPGMGGGIRG